MNFIIKHKKKTFDSETKEFVENLQWCWTQVAWFNQITSSFIEHSNEQIPQGIPCTEPELIPTDGTISMTYRRISQDSDSSRPPCVDSMARLSSNSSSNCPICNRTALRASRVWNSWTVTIKSANSVSSTCWDSSRVKYLLCHQKTPLWQTHRDNF